MEQVLDVPLAGSHHQGQCDRHGRRRRLLSRCSTPRGASYEVANLQIALLNLVMTNIRTVMGSMDLDQLLSHRDEINARLLNVVDAAVGPGASRPTGSRSRISCRRATSSIDGPADEGRAREARQHPRSRGPAPGRDLRAEGRKQAFVLEAEGPRRPRSASPRRASAAPRRKRSRRTW